MRHIEDGPESDEFTDGAHLMGQAALEKAASALRHWDWQAVDMPPGATEADLLDVDYDEGTEEHDWDSAQVHRSGIGKCDEDGRNDLPDLIWLATHAVESMREPGDILAWYMVHAGFTTRRGVFVTGRRFRRTAQRVYDPYAESALAVLTGLQRLNCRAVVNWDGSLMVGHTSDALLDSLFDKLMPPEVALAEHLGRDGQVRQEWRAALYDALDDTEGLTHERDAAAALARYPVLRSAAGLLLWGYLANPVTAWTRWVTLRGLWESPADPPIPRSECGRGTASGRYYDATWEPVVPATYLLDTTWADVEDALAGHALRDWTRRNGEPHLLTLAAVRGGHYAA